MPQRIGMKNPIPSTLDPGNDSVLDSGPEKLLKAVMDFFGARDPEQQLPVPPAVGVTTFLKNGVPDVIARKAATAKNLGLLRRMMGLTSSESLSTTRREDIEDAMKVARRYPRVMAHTTPESELLPASRGSAAFYPTVGEPGRGKIIFADMPRTAGEFPTDVAHELTHSAQNIGLKSIDPTRVTPSPYSNYTSWGDESPMMGLYKLLHGETGYKNNPMEVSARSVARRKVNEIAPTGLRIPRRMQERPAENVMDALRRLGFLK